MSARGILDTVIARSFRRARLVLVKSPVVIGGSAVLIGLIMTLLAYNATSGLPFIRTYDIYVKVPDAQKLTTGVDVRIGGTRIGQLAAVEAVKPKGKDPYAILTLRLDRNMEYVRSDSAILIRPSSILGAKYVEFIPGTTGRFLKFQETIPKLQTRAAVNVEEVTGLFDKGVRDAFGRIIKTGAYGFAGRGAALNEAYGELPALTERGRQAIEIFADPKTNVAGFLRGAAATTSSLEPVLNDFGPLLRGARQTFKAFADSAPDVGRGFQEIPPTMRNARRNFPVITPVLRDAADLAKEVRSATVDLPETARSLNRAVVAAIPVQRQTRKLPKAAEGLVDGLDKVVRNPNLRKSTPLLKSLVNTLGDISDGPVGDLQRRCNYMGLYLRNAASVLSEGDKNGGWFRGNLILNLAAIFHSTGPTPGEHYNVYPDSVPGKCSVGNEGYEPGENFGNPVGVTATSNPSTSAPPGTPKGPQ